MIRECSGSILILHNVGELIRHVSRHSTFTFFFLQVRRLQRKCRRELFQNRVQRRSADCFPSARVM